MWVTSSLANALTPTAIALGNFDGIHRGHQQVIQPAVNAVKLSAVRNECVLPRLEMKGAKDNRQKTEARIYSTVVTFNPHPREFFSGKPQSLLTPLTEKVQQLEKLGVEQLILLPFNRELAALSPQEFVELLVLRLRCAYISVGENFCFGKKRSGTATDLSAIAGRFGIPVNIVPIYNWQGNDRISSSAIRQALEQGDLQRAKILLGRPYTLSGCVVEGQQLGRTIGFPTANLQLPENKFLPRQGVYAVRVFIEAETTPILGVMNIGNRPTVNGIQPTIEVHLLDWFGNLYGKTITVQPEKFIRAEQKFADLEALKAQIQTDCAIAVRSLTTES